MPFTPKLDWQYDDIVDAAAINRWEQGILNATIDTLTTTNIGNAYSITPATPITSYVVGKTFRIAINASSSNSATLNVSALGAIPIRKVNGESVKLLVLGGIYTVTYSSANTFIIQDASYETEFLTTTNSGNDYSLYCNPGSVPVSGIPYRLMINASSTGNTRLRLNTGTYYNILTLNGERVTRLFVNSVYTLIFNGTNFILQGNTESDSPLRASVTYHVGKSGNDSNSGTTVNSQFLTIAKAVSMIPKHLINTTVIIMIGSGDFSSENLILEGYYGYCNVGSNIDEVLTSSGILIYGSGPTTIIGKTNVSNCTIIVTMEQIKSNECIVYNSHNVNFYNVAAFNTEAGFDFINSNGFVFSCDANSLNIVVRSRYNSFVLLMGGSGSSNIVVAWASLGGTICYTNVTIAGAAQQYTEIGGLIY